MEAAPLSHFMALAEAFDYPAAGRLEALQRGLARMPNGAGKEAFSAFLECIARLSLEEWEELYTRTLDLNPPAAPYIGYQVWGDSYQRGKFMAALSDALAAAGVATGGELPDHLAPSLRYLATAPQPWPELVTALGQALERMLAALRDKDPENPYLKLLSAVQALCQDLQKEEA